MRIGVPIDCNAIAIQVLAMGVALGITVFGAATGAVAALAACGPAGPAVAVGILVSCTHIFILSTLYVTNLRITSSDRRRDCRNIRARCAHRIHRENQP